MTALELEQSILKQYWEERELASHFKMTVSNIPYHYHGGKAEALKETLIKINSKYVTLK